MAAAVDPSLSDQLAQIRRFNLAELQPVISVTIGPHLPLNYIGELCPDQQEVVFRVSLMLYVVTFRAQIPREFQLKAFLAAYKGQDCLLNAGTGSGKTMSLVLSLLYDDPLDHRITLTISPLKRLQLTQVAL